MEDLRGLVLDGLDLDLVGRVLPLAMPEGLLQPLDRVHRDRVSARALELVQLLHQGLRAREEAGGEPHELPAALLAEAVAVLGQLLHDLAVDLVAEDFLKNRNDMSVYGIEEGQNLTKGFLSFYLNTQPLNFNLTYWYCLKWH